MMVALFVLITRGAHGEGQTGVFNTVVQGYIVETSASIGRIITRPTIEIIDINTLAASDTNQVGQGGESPESSPLELSTVQQNSLMAFTPPSEDYIEQTGSHRSEVVEYTVQSGDLISFIASDYGVSVNSILWANNLKSADTIKPGQVLKIPPTSGVIHKVKRGDTVTLLAKKYGANEEKIIAFNSLPQGGALQLDDEIVIPEGKPQQSVVSRVTSSIVPKIDVRQFAHLPDLADFFMIPTTGFNWGKIHGRNGVDIANACGTPIYAAASGVVITADDAGWNGGFGKYIKIMHTNGTETLYAHATKLKVVNGQNVEKGEIVASMGTTGNSTGCHLHFEVHGAHNPLAKN
jgi:murein DD-endopeptidase MepM/ murein hydrolase activator NlpD